MRLQGWTSSRTRSRRALLGVVAAIAVAGLLAVPGAAPAAKKKDVSADCAGAPGIGDPYYPTYGNGGYDVRKYNLDVAYKPANDQLRGTAKIRATATQRLCRFNLDLDGMLVHRVEVDGDKARFRREAQELIITPDDTLKKGERFRVEIRYGGVPTEFQIPGTDIRAGFMATPEGATVAGQPEVAAGWFPVNDHPLDKASYTFRVTVPNAYEVAANGYLRDRDRRGSKTTWLWRAPDPMASYLATIDIGQWDVTRSTQAGLPVYDAVASQITGGLRAEIDDSLSRQGEIINRLASWFGAYPFGTAGGIVPNQEDLRFALETQTRSVYSKRFWLTSQGVPRDADWVVVHEMAHQWAGDDVALARWQDIWLNEGFASWAEWDWEEYLGNATAQEIFQATYDAIPADDPFWSVPIGDPGVTDLFSDPVYVRGAMTVQALRNEVGEAAFRTIVRQWFASQAGGHGTTPEFIALAESVSGQDLDAFFDTWLFSTEKPPPEAVEPAARAAAQADGSGASSFRDEVRSRLQIGPY